MIVCNHFILQPGTNLCVCGYTRDEHRPWASGGSGQAGGSSGASGFAIVTGSGSGGGGSAGGSAEVFDLRRRLTAAQQAIDSLTTDLEITRAERDTVARDLVERCEQVFEFIGRLRTLIDEFDGVMSGQRQIRRQCAARFSMQVNNQTLCCVLDEGHDDWHVSSEFDGTIHKWRP